MAPPEDAADPCAVTVTRLLNAAGAGDPRAAEELLPLVYERLRSLAARNMRGERSDHTMQATSLVHEAYLRLVDVGSVQLWDSRWHFFAAAATSMRRILVDSARSKRREKRGGNRQRVDLESLEMSVDPPPDDLVALDAALTELAVEHPAKARLVDLRFFGGLTNDESAQAMGISPSTADRNWSFARAWLYRKMSGSI